MNLLLQTFSLIFGLVPFNSNELDSNVAVDYSLVVIMPLLYIFCYYYVNFRGINAYQLTDCNSICHLSSILFMHVGCFLYLTIYLLTLLRRKAFYVEFGKRLQEIDELNVACIKVADTSNKLIVPQKKRLFYITWIFVLTAFGFAIFYDVNKVFKYYGPYCLILNMVITFPYVAASTVQGIFISYVSVISERFRILNILFNKINQESDRKNSPLSVLDIENEYRKYNHRGPAVISNLAKSKTKKEIQTGEKSVNSSNNYGSDSAEEDSGDDMYNSGAYDEPRLNDGKTSETNLPRLFKLHDKILSLSVLVNSEFGPQCVPYMAACFVITIFGIFLETKVMFIVGGKNELMDYVIYLYVIWSFTTMMVGYLVLRLCCQTYAHSKQSAMIVHEIMQKKPTFMLGNDIYYNKMKAFTLQFLHWEGYFQFNGIGLFVLDYTFIFSVSNSLKIKKPIMRVLVNVMEKIFQTVSAATSYLIVLLQFDMTAILKSEGLTPKALGSGAI
ncbi:gustatory and pheromone receptor 33a [Anastrepha ludens]|uniref:Gustatory receptor n=1 Tax=Anastrepha ludens TaxID=28586 RepID=A0A9E8IIJ6_9MUSC|nr:gustatory and pheromone receptor 33a [Anastrepha ludens]UZH23415.1 gustatory receptor 33a [Anastrepha ludens]